MDVSLSPGLIVIAGQRGMRVQIVGLVELAGLVGLITIYRTL